jgi:hypothetical protein
MTDNTTGITDPVPLDLSKYTNEELIQLFEACHPVEEHVNITSTVTFQTIRKITIAITFLVKKNGIITATRSLYPENIKGVTKVCEEYNLLHEVSNLDVFYQIFYADFDDIPLFINNKCEISKILVAWRLNIGH